jgi:cell division protease FtsH
VPVGLLITMLVVLGPSVADRPATSLSYSEFVTKIQTGQVKSVVIDDKGKLTAVLTSGKSFTSQIPTALDNGRLERLLEAKKVNVKATQTGSSASTVLLSLLPLLLLVGFFLWTGRPTQRALGGGSQYRRSRAKLIETERPTTRFTDVAGYEGVKQEIGEVVDFLRNPDRYLAAGAVGPRGVVMVGPPGTGKTLLARAVAGEADVPFLSVTGSAFVEMFVASARPGSATCLTRPASAHPRSSSLMSWTRWWTAKRRRGQSRGTRADAQPAARRAGRLRCDQRCRGARRDQPAGDARSGAASARPLRPSGCGAAPNQAERAAILAVHSRGKHLGQMSTSRWSRGRRPASPVPTSPTW